MRASAPEELKAALTPIWHFFGGTPSDEGLERLRHVLEPTRVLVASDDGTIVGGAGAFTFRMTVPGGRLPTAGVTVVGVLPTHRRRGILTRMMRTQLDDGPLEKLAR